jgi:hypothetical protein
LADDALLGVVDPGAAEIPVYLAGTLDDGVGDDLLVTAVNGRIAAVTPTFERDGNEETFALLVPPGLLRSGTNDVELLLLDSAGVTHPIEFG